MLLLTPPIWRAFRYTYYMDISQTIHLLGDIPGSVISELEPRELFKAEERIRAAAKNRRAGKAKIAPQRGCNAIMSKPTHIRPNPISATGIGGSHNV